MKKRNYKELADDYLYDFYEENGIEQLFDIDDAEY